MTNETIALPQTSAAISARSSSKILFGILTALLVLAVLYSLTLGRYPVSVADVARIVFTTVPFRASQPYSNAPWVVVEMIRMPRVLAVTLCGAGLAMAGAAAQGIFRNPLVAPEIMGVSSGASLGAVLAIMLGWGTGEIVGLAFAIAFIALLAAVGLAKMGGQAGGILVLVFAGIIVSSFCSALMGFLEYTADPSTKLPQIVFWLLGSFVGMTYDKVTVIAAAALIGGTGLLMLSWRINILSLGDVDAAALGINVSRLRWMVLLLISLLVAAQVSIGGIVGWVGLVVPHMARMLVGPEHTKLVPASALLGAIFLLAVDDVARVLVSAEIPIGVLTGAVGTPIFALLFWRQQGKGWSHE